MLEGIQQLLELQRLDDELLASEEEYAALPGRRERVIGERTACDTRLTEAQDALGAAEAGQREAEGALQDGEALLAKLEGQQFQVKSNEAYTALLHEMEVARNVNSAHETKILESMEAIESTTSGLANANEEVTLVRLGLDEEERAIEARDAELTAGIARLRARRAEVGPSIVRELLEKYERVAKRRRPAVVLVSGELCGGCRVGIPAQVFIEILRGEKVISCVNCARILVHQEKVESEAAS